MFSSLAFLSYAHLSRQIIDYGGYVLDISGPFMIAVQKMTSLGFCLHDGYRKTRNQAKATSPLVKEASPDDNDESRSLSSGESLSEIHSDKSSGVEALTKEQEKYAIIDRLSFGDFMGYFFHFPSVLCGPIMYYNDYSDFVNAPEGKNLPPGRHMAVSKKLLISATCAILHLTLNPRFEVEFLRSPEFLIHTPLLMRFYYIFIFTVLSRLKYYVAWHLGEAISNASGLGFNGYDSNGKPCWNLISNMNLWKFETSLNFRDAIHAWNRTTQSWLRRTAYERAPKKLAVLATYLLSAVWHGFYPGYYMTFLGGALFTYASRNARHIIRPFFQKGTILPKVYDVITFTLTRIAIAYVAFPFVILDFRNNLEIYRSLYFSIHILALGGLAIGFFSKRKPENK